MANEYVEISSSGRMVHWYTYIGDFVNILKPYIGASYQSMPFSFACSGLGFGVVGVFIIAALSDHCSQMLVRCKGQVVDSACDVDADTATSGKVTASRDDLHRDVSYAHISRQVFGEWCYQLTQFAIWLTQFSWCVVYFIFISNTILEIWPLATYHNATTSHMTLTTSHAFSHSTATTSDNFTSSPATTMTSTTRSSTVTTSSTTLMSSAWTSSAHTTEAPHTFSTAPDLRLLILIPLPLFIVTSLIRKVRYLAPVSSVGTVAVIVGACSCLGFIVYEFHVVKYSLYKFATLPLFLSQIIACFEGVGCLLPVHSSMQGTRHYFSCFVHINIYLVASILCCFGVLGYLRYGDAVSQILVQEITQHTMLAVLVDATLILSVLCTYPLQCYPVIDIVEAYVFTFTERWCKKKEKSTDCEDDSQSHGGLLTDSTAVVNSSTPLLQLETATVATVPTWQRNVLRVTLTLVIAGVAMLLRNAYAYLIAFVGAVGCSVLAFILPCMIDVRLNHAHMSRLAIVKDVVIIVLAVSASVSAVVCIIIQVVNGKM